MKSRKTASSMIVPEGLRGHNFENWKMHMKSYLMGQGLWDIVEGKECEPDQPNSPEFKAWTEKNGRALHAILISCEEEFLSFILKKDSAKDAWDQLALISEGKTGQFGEEEADLVILPTIYRPLSQAVFWGDWDKAKSLLEAEQHQLDSEAATATAAAASSSTLFTACLTPGGGTVLHLAVTTGSLHLVEKLLELMSPEEAITRTTKPPLHTPLHYAARTGSTKIAEVLVRKNRDSLQIQGADGLIPVAVASTSGHKEITSYLYSVTSKEALIEGDGRNSGASLLVSAIVHEMYDIALDLLGHCSELAIAQDIFGRTTICALAIQPNAFPSGRRYSTWQRWIYTCTPIYNERDVPSADVGGIKKDHITTQASRWLVGVVWKALNLLVPCIKSIHSRKRIHVQALGVLKCVCSEMSRLDIPKLVALGLGDSLDRAVSLGIVEIVKELIKIDAHLLFKQDNQKLNILSAAILFRQEKIFNLICGIGGTLTILSRDADNNGNNILHQAGKSPSSSSEQRKTNMPAGAALQMQRELQWFREVEKISPAVFGQMPNSKGLRPREVFTEEHEELLKEGEKWMKDTANSCMVVATLIATFTFAAAFTAPGGFNQQSGYPIFLNTNKVFFVFIISDALSLFSSSTSLLMFLSIYTSRYEEEDFLKSLPKRLIIGLSTLFFSIATMMVAFCATMFLILGEHHKWISIPITFLAGVPVTLFVLLQFPLFLDMVSSTYGPELFNRA